MPTKPPPQQRWRPRDSSPPRGGVHLDSVVFRSENETTYQIEAACMTTQQKITAIQAIVANHQDNVAAMQAANVGQGLGALVIEAMNTALKNDLTVIFAANSSRPTAQKVRRKRQT